MKRYDRVLKEYIDLFGNCDDVYKYVSTWEYKENDFIKLAERLEYCVKVKKRYEQVYISFLEKIYYKTLYKVLTRNIEDV